MFTFLFSGSGSLEVDLQIQYFIRGKFALVTKAYAFSPLVRMNSAVSGAITYKQILEPFSSGIKYTLCNRDLSLTSYNESNLEQVEKVIKRYYED